MINSELSQSESAVSIEVCTCCCLWYEILMIFNIQKSVKSQMVSSSSPAPALTQHQTVFSLRSFLREPLPPDLKLPVLKDSSFSSSTSVLRDVFRWKQSLEFTFAAAARVLTHGPRSCDISTWTLMSHGSDLEFMDSKSDPWMRLQD